MVIPAHDEEDGIGETVRSGLALDYPARLFEVLVVADNCTDRTAGQARQAGASRRAIGRDAEEQGVRDRRPDPTAGATGEFDELDALVVVDADSTVDPGLLRAFARGLDAGHDWIQCYDSVGNADQSWRTRLMAYAFSLINGVTLEGQMGLGLSAALRGNGMCLSTRGLARVPWQTHGLTEDLEYSWMVRIAGGRIAFDRGAAVYATMLSRGGPASRTQRQRWETGRAELRKRMFRPILRSAHLRPIEKAASLVELTMPTTVSLCSAYLVLTALAALRLPEVLPYQTAGYLVVLGLSHAIATLGLALRFASPFLLAFLPWRFSLCLLHVPYYACWKLLVALSGRPRTWVRTVREPAFGTFRPHPPDRWPAPMVPARSADRPLSRAVDDRPC